MEAVQFVEERFPRENPKILGRDSCIAILEMRYGPLFAELSKKKLGELLQSLREKLVVVRPRQRRSTAQRR